MCRQFLPVTLSKSSHRARRSCCTCGRRQDQEVCTPGPHVSIRPAVMETSGTVGPKSRDFLRELGKRIRMVTREPQSYAFLMQRITVAIQIGNATSVIASLPVNATTEVGSEVRSVETESLASFLNQPKVLKRTPRKSRTMVARKLATLVDLTASRNDIPCERGSCSSRESACSLHQERADAGTSQPW